MKYARNIKSDINSSRQILLGIKMNEEYPDSNNESDSRTNTTISTSCSNIIGFENDIDSDNDIGNGSNTYDNVYEESNESNF